MKVSKPVNIRPENEDASISRRQFLKSAGLLAGAAATGSLLLAGACKKVVTQTIVITTTPPETSVHFPPANGLEYLLNSDPSTIDNSALAVTPPELLHVLNPSPEVDIDGYKLSVHGLVSNPLNLTYADLQKFPMIEKTALLICPMTFADNETLGGIPLVSLLDAAGVKAEATQLVFRTLDYLHQSVSITDLISGDAFLALTLNGNTLPREHGYPLRLIRPGQIGVFWMKCVSDIEVV